MYVSSVCFCDLLLITGNWRRSSDRLHIVGHHRPFCRRRIGAINGDHLSIGARRHSVTTGDGKVKTIAHSDQSLLPPSRVNRAARKLKSTCKCLCLPLAAVWFLKCCWCFFNSTCGPLPHSDSPVRGTTDHRIDRSSSSCMAVQLTFCPISYNLVLSLLAWANYYWLAGEAIINK